MSVKATTIIIFLVIWSLLALIIYHLIVLRVEHGHIMKRLDVLIQAAQEKSVGTPEE